MATATRAKKPQRAASGLPWGEIPTTLRILYITTRQRTGGWLAEAFASDSAARIVLDQVVGGAAGLARARDESFDAVLISHEPEELDALTLIEGYRAGGADEPILVLGMQSEQEMASLCYEVGADAYVCVNTATTRNLIWVLVRAVQRHELLRENRRLAQAEQQRLQRDRDEAERVLQQQRAMLAGLDAKPGPEGSDADATKPDARPPAPLPSLPEELVAHYRELLRSYVIMGSGNMTCELSRLADLLVSAGLGSQQAMQLHLQALEEMVHGLGARSTRHVMTRADLLAMEILLHLAEGYRRRHHQLLHPPRQRLLPGFY